jgi:hypothetical protein
MTKPAVDDGWSYVYGLRAADSADYFYVGSTKKTPAVRLKEHLAPARLGCNRNLYFVRTVRRVGPENVVADTLQRVCPGEQFVREYEWVARFLNAGARLTNIVTDARTYVSSREQEDYCEEVIEPGRLLAGLASLFDDVPTPNPRDQALADKFRDVALVYLRHLLTHYREPFLAYLAGESVDILRL